MAKPARLRLLSAMRAFSAIGAMAAIAVLALSASLRAQNEPVYDVGKDVTPPRVIHQVNPKVPDNSQGFRITGVVLIGLVVSSHGDPVNVHVVRSLEKDVDASAVEAVREWRFEPARKDGNPVAARVTVEVRFHDM